MSIDEILDFEASMGYESAFSYRKMLLKKADMLSGTELVHFLDEATISGYFNREDREFIYPFYNESLALVLNKNGKFKIGRTTYKFKGLTQVLTADLSGLEHKGDSDTLKKVIHLNNNPIVQLKSGEMIKETMLSDNRLRCLLQLKREYFAEEGPIIVNGQPSWGIIGYYWSVYYRFYSYKQFALYKSDRPTYFNWKTNRLGIGGNQDRFPLLDYYNPNPPTERTISQRAIEHVHFYSSTYLTPAPGLAPAINLVQVSDFWSDFMYNFHGSLIYP